jgi:hypothetical protein
MGPFDDQKQVVPQVWGRKNRQGAHITRNQPNFVKSLPTPLKIAAKTHSLSPQPLRRPQTFGRTQKQDHPHLTVENTRTLA